MSDRVNRLNVLEIKVRELEEQVSLIRQYLQTEEVKKIMNDPRKSTHGN
jgi:hypothetical protein